MARIAAIGEVMVELAPCPINTGLHETRETFSLSFAGDTYNTSVYMARLGLQTEYVTNLGDDPYSKKILQQMMSENIGTTMITSVQGRSPGLYIIQNTKDGEREFFYWRKEAPARELFSTVESSQYLLENLKQFDCIYLSGITAAIIGKQSRVNLLGVLEKLRAQGVKIAYDSNYRPRLWTDKTEAQQAMLDIMRHVDIALLTLDDEFLLWGDTTVAGCKQRYPGLKEIILKRGADDTIVLTQDSQISIPISPVDGVIDTTGAGDSFNAGYLAARLQKLSIETAVKNAIKCASIIIRHRGAVIEKSIFEAEISA